MAKRPRKRRSVDEVLQSLGEWLYPDRLTSQKIHLHSRAKDGDTPLHAAIYRDDNYGATLLIEVGADINAVGNTGYTPLHAAVFEGNAALVEALLEAGADQRVRCRDGKLVRDLIAESRNDIARLFGRFPAP